MIGFIAGVILGYGAIWIMGWNGVASPGLSLFTIGAVLGYGAALIVNRKAIYPRTKMRPS